MPTTSTIRPDPTHQQGRGLEAALDSVIQQFGPSVVATPNGTAATPPAVIATGSLALDHALGVGGLPKGRITEIYGPEGVGKTTLALSVLAQAQRTGGTGLFVGSGEVAVVVIDSIAALVPQAELDGQIGQHHAGVQANLLSQALRQLAGPIHRPNTAVVATNQLRQRAGTPGQTLYTAGGRALGYYASVRLHLRLAKTVTQQDQLLGTRVQVQVTKNKLAPAWQACELEIHSDHGLSGEASLVDLGLDAGLLTQRGSCISYGSVQLGRGRQAAHRHLRDHPKLTARLEAELRSRLDKTPTVEAAAS